LEVRFPTAREELKMVEMAIKNAAVHLSQMSQRKRREVAALDELARLLGLENAGLY
jgi:excinuclease ABC subunit C